MKQTYKKIPMPVRYVINTLLFVAFLIVGLSLIQSGVITKYYTKVLMLIGINIILTVSLNIATGYLGQLPLGHAGFMAVGAYTAAIFMTRSGLDASVSFPIGLVLGALMAGLVGVLIGIPALRLKGDYLAIITLGFGEIIRVVLLNIDSVLGFKLTYGAASLKGIPKETNFLNTFLCVGIACLLIHTMMKSRHGRAILSVRENEIAAESCGINLTYYKVLGFAASAVFAGLAGALYAGYLGILNPSSFGFMKSIEILVMVVLGGMGSMVGSVLSATVLTAVPELLRAFSEYRMILYSLLLITVMIFKPSGLMGQYDFSLSRMLEHVFNQKPAREKTNHKAGEKNG
ncbi:MAG: branched-chain amino acid ABC transporter permease [Eubacteriales bacterium]|nr:branched-chain amino acid ABC transporter permease [Eubacteriales bacterium]